MARFLSKSQSFLRQSTIPNFPFNSSSLIPISFSRHRSSRSGKVELIEIDLDSSSSSSSAPSSSSSSVGDSEVLATRKLDDVVNMIVVRRSTPDWLPFVPGSSFWVPPRRTKPVKVFDLFDKLAEPFAGAGEDSLSFISGHGWPCSDFFTTDSGADSTLVDGELEPSTKVKSEMEVKVATSTENSNHPDDDEK